MRGQLAATIAADLVDLVLPSRCVACRRPGTVWCLRCRPEPSPRRSQLSAELSVTAAGDYEDGLRSALLAYKERGQRSLAPALAGYLDSAVDDALLTDGPAAGRPVAVALIPSARGAASERGGDHLRRLCRRSALAGLPRARLRLTGPVRDSAGLSIAARKANLSCRMRAAPPPDWAQGHPVLIVDDIVTTGATLTEANRALAAAGWRVCGAVVVAATRRRWPEHDNAGGVADSLATQKNQGGFTVQMRPDALA